jgi:hypothetical protein
LGYADNARKAHRRHPALRKPAMKIDIPTSESNGTSIAVSAMLAGT